MAYVSLPIEGLDRHYDVVVVGSGYGGAIAASRLARAGRRVCLLERGREIRPGQYPRTAIEAGKEAQVDRPEEHWGDATGLYDLRVNDDINVFQGCGLGGTSLVNANVSLRAEPRVFDDEVWPQALRSDGALLETCYEDALRMLGATPLPESLETPKKTIAHHRSADALQETFRRPPLNVTFEDGVNPVGVRQRACVMCGDCVSGCNYTSKNTVLMNYLPDARNHGAQIFTEAGVRHLERKEGRWLVHFQVLDSGRARFDAPTLFVSADLVVLSAGTLGSTEILLRSKKAGLSLSGELGNRFSGNGDVLGFAYNCDRAINGIGYGALAPEGRDEVGPCITSMIDIREKESLDEGYVVEEGSIPGPLAKLLPALLGWGGAVLGRDTDRGALDYLREKGRQFTSWLRGPYHGAVHNTQTFLVMTHDDAGGRMYLEDDRLRISWPDVGRQPTIDGANRHLFNATRPHGGTYVKNPLWTELFDKRLTTVHPLGGCPMAEAAERGVVNHKGQVFSGQSGTEVYEDLYVTDGSVIPRSVGVNPLLTIAALSERCARLIASDRGWSVDERLESPPEAEDEPPPVGLQFSETMKGHFSTSVTKPDYHEGARRGRSDDSPLEFILTIVARDLDHMIAHPEHPARTVGTVLAPKLSDKPLTVLGGHFNLFVDDPTDPNLKRMRYRMRLVSDAGKLFYFDGFKVIRDDPGLDVWPDTTTLYITIYEGEDDRGTVRGRGVLRIHPEDFLRQMRTLRVLGARTWAQELTAQLRFGKLFAGAVFDTYGPDWLSRREPLGTRLGRLAGRTALGVAAVAAVLAVAFPWRPNILRDPPPIVEEAAPRAGALPADVAALGLFPQYLEGVDLSPGAYTIEREVLHASWVEDNIVQDHGGLVAIPFHPADIAPLSDLSLLRGFMNLTRLRDGANRIVGIGSQVETVTLDSNPLQHVINANTDWTFTFQDRGVMFLSQKEGGATLGELQAAADEAGETWVGREEVNHTLGPLPDARGIIHGGTGQFAGIVGSFQEYNIVLEVPVEGDLVARSRYELSYLKPTETADGRGRRADVPEEVAAWGLPSRTLARIDFSRPYAVRERIFHASLPGDVLYQTRGRETQGAVIPASLGVRDAPALARVRKLMLKLRSESGIVVGEAGGSTVAAAAGDGSSFAQWTLTLPGEGTLYLAPEAAASAGAEADSVLGSSRGVILGGTGHYANAAGFATERILTADGRSDLELHLHYVSPR